MVGGMGLTFNWQMRYPSRHGAPAGPHQHLDGVRHPLPRARLRRAAGGPGRRPAGALHSLRAAGPRGLCRQGARHVRGDRLRPRFAPRGAGPEAVGRGGGGCLRRRRQHVPPAEDAPGPRAAASSADEGADGMAYSGPSAGSTSPARRSAPRTTCRSSSRRPSTPSVSSRSRSTRTISTPIPARPTWARRARSASPSSTRRTTAVVGLREGAMLRVEERVGGPHRHCRREDLPPREAAAGGRAGRADRVVGRAGNRGRPA